jgi:acetyl-CoA carboxylase biotin carboxyl carrier protein
MEIKSNMAGTVLEVLVAVGDSVEEGQDVICLESMKMQMYISAEEAGTVKEIKTEVGDFVNEGDSLVVLE